MNPMNKILIRLIKPRKTGKLFGVHTYNYLFIHVRGDYYIPILGMPLQFFESYLYNDFKDAIEIIMKRNRMLKSPLQFPDFQNLIIKKISRSLVDYYKVVKKRKSIENIIKEVIVLDFPSNPLFSTTLITLYLLNIKPELIIGERVKKVYERFIENRVFFTGEVRSNYYVNRVLYDMLSHWAEEYFNFGKKPFILYPLVSGKMQIPVAMWSNIGSEYFNYGEELIIDVGVLAKRFYRKSHPVATLLIADDFPLSDKYTRDALKRVGNMVFLETGTSVIKVYESPQKIPIIASMEDLKRVKPLLDRALEIFRVAEIRTLAKKSIQKGDDIDIDGTIPVGRSIKLGKIRYTFTVIPDSVDDIRLYSPGERVIRWKKPSFNRKVLIFDADLLEKYYRVIEVSDL